MVDSKEHAWRLEKRITLRGWQWHESFAGTFEEAIKRAGALLNSDECIYQVRFERLGHDIRGGYYIPQWLE